MDLRCNQSARIAAQKNPDSGGYIPRKTRKRISNGKGCLKRQWAQYTTRRLPGFPADDEQLIMDSTLRHLQM
jgi:hypothetical protein